MPVVAIEYIEVDDRGVARVVGTRSKVRQIVVSLKAGLSPEQIRAEYPHLSLAQIHAALAYYYDHQEAVDAEIAAAARSATEMRAGQPSPHTREELEARWRHRFGTEPPSAEPPPAGG